jgi:hypothetical protein
MKTALSIIFGILLIAIIIYAIGAEEVLTVISQADIACLLPALLATPLIWALQSIRLKMILDLQKYQVSLKDTAKIHIASVIVSALTPFIKVSGTPLKIFALTRRNIPASRAFASVTAEALLDAFLFIAVFTLLLAGIYFEGPLPSQLLYIGASISLALLIAALSLPKIFSRKNLENLLKFIAKRYPNLRPEQDSKNFRLTVSRVIKDRKIIAASAAVSTATCIIDLARIWLILSALGISAGLTLVIAAWIAIMALASVPGLPGGLGIVEGGTASFMAFLGVPPAAALSFAIIDRLVSIWLPMLLGIPITANLDLKNKV